MLISYAKYKLDNIEDKGNLAKLVDIQVDKFIAENYPILSLYQLVF